MATLKMIDGSEIKLSRVDSKRLVNMVRRNGMNFRVMDSGVMVNISNIAAIFPEAGDIEQEPAARPEATAAPSVLSSSQEPQRDTAGEGKDGKDDDDDDGIYNLHVGQLKAILDNSGLSQEEFGKSIGYSLSSVRMALKEGRISKPFAKAVLEKYGAVQENRDVKKTEPAETLKESARDRKAEIAQRVSMALNKDKWYKKQQ